jgi:hypothetical protein
VPEVAVVAPSCGAVVPWPAADDWAVADAEGFPVALADALALAGADGEPAGDVLGRLTLFRPWLWPHAARTSNGEIKRGR